MDWIETLFGVSPDGGDGSTEALIVVACMIAVPMLVVALSSKLRSKLRALFSRRPLDP
jgi:hypothetical protein